MENKNMKNIETVTKNALEIAGDLYSKMGGLDPMLSVDFDWLRYNKQSGQTMLGLFLNSEQMVTDRFKIAGLIGYISALLVRLEISGDPKCVVFVSEAWVSKNNVNPPSEDPKREEVVVAAAVDKDSSVHVRMAPIRYQYSETEDGISRVVKRIERGAGADDGYTAESPLLKNFWNAYNITLDAMDKENGDMSYKNFIEFAKTDPDHTVKMIFDSVFKDLYGKTGDLISQSNEKNT